jgi:hypothetical protein
MQMYLACHRRRHVGEPVVVDWQFVNDEGGLVVVSCCIKNEQPQFAFASKRGGQGGGGLKKPGGLRQRLSLSSLLSFLSLVMFFNGK